MPRLQRLRYLTCFYCGHKTSTQYTPGVRHFDCPYCDATNYLDHNGEITDPPVATEKVATPAKYAVQRASSPPSSAQSSAFCATCLKNQHLLSAILAQYLPDPEDPEYAERERGYYRFRKHQEKLYPQICADCEPRVRERLEQAAYTAKTDVLRRMIDRSATTRKVVKQSGPLDFISTTGGWLRTVSVLLQVIWHASILVDLLSNYYLYFGANEPPLAAQAVKICESLVGFLPSPEWLIKWSFITCLLSFWWNPHFAQYWRGFTKHLSGVSKWYTYQAMLSVGRLLAVYADLPTPDPSRLTLQASPHIGALAFTVLINILSQRSIRIDMTPLFATSPKPPTFEDAPLDLEEDHETYRSKKSSKSRLDETKSMSELLDEISRSPPRSESPPSPTEGDHFIPPLFGGARADLRYGQQQQQQQQQAIVIRHDDEDELPLDSLHLSQQPVTVQYDQEMDWSPTQSKHRAFNTVGQRTTQGFNQAPAEIKGPFWYRVPPAPTTPAQRTFNPPNRPLLRQSPNEIGGSNLFIRGGSTTSNRTGNVLLERTNKVRHGHNRQRSGGGSERNESDGEPRHSVQFAEPSFFPPQPQNDPRNSLASMFGESLALREEQQQRQTQRQLGKSSWLTRKFFGNDDGGGGASTAVVRKSKKDA